MTWNNCILKCICVIETISNLLIECHKLWASAVKFHNILETCVRDGGLKYIASISKELQWHGFYLNETNCKITISLCLTFIIKFSSLLQRHIEWDYTAAIRFMPAIFHMQFCECISFRFVSIVSIWWVFAVNFCFLYSR